MSNKAEVVCPCGKLLGTRSNGSSGTMVCPSCKQKVSFQVKNGSAYTSYK